MDLEKYESISMMKNLMGEVVQYEGEPLEGYYHLDEGILCFKDGLLHCENGPAFSSETENSIAEYYRKGKLHNVNAPAVEGYNLEGKWIKEFWDEGKLIKVEIDE